MSRLRPVGAAVIAFAPSLFIIAIIEALIATRLPMPPGMTLWNLDIPKIDAPLAVFMSEALDHGRLPLWNDRLGLGFPLYAEGQIGAFYPPNWLLFQLDPLDALAVSRVVHLAAAGVGVGLLALRITGSRPGAVVATSVAVLGGAIVTKLEWTNLVAAYAWLPWILLPLSRRPAPSRAGLVAAGLTWGLQALTGHPNMWLLTGVSAVVLLVASRPDRPAVGRVLMFGALGGAVGAIQLVPTLLLTTLSVRSLGLTANDVFSSAATPFDPMGFGFAQPFIRSDANGWNVFTGWYPDGIFALLEASAFVGLAVVALAAAGGDARRARPWLAIGGVMLAIPVIAAFRPAPWLDIPILNGLRSPVRSYIVLALVLGILAAIGIARTRHRPTVGATRRAAVAVGALIVVYVSTLAVAVVAPAVFAAVYAMASNGLSAADIEARRSLAVAALASPLPVVLEISLGIAAIALLSPRSARPPATLALLLLVVVPLALLSPMANTIRPATDAVLTSSELVVTLRDYAPNRVLTLDPPGFAPPAPDRLAAAGIADLDMFSSLNLLATDRLVERARHGPDAEDVRALVGVDVLATFGRPCPGADDRQLTEDQAVVCRVEAIGAPFWVPAAVVTPDDSGGSAIRPRDAMIDVALAARDAISGETISESPDELVARVTAPASGYVWIDRAWWPGWSVTVDGSPTPAMRALAGQLVPVTAGTHDIGLRLIPWDAFIGVVSAILASVLAGVWIVRGRRTPGEGVLGGVS